MKSTLSSKIGLSECVIAGVAALVPQVLQHGLGSYLARRGMAYARAEAREQIAAAASGVVLACGAALEQPVVRDGSVVPGVRMTATLSLDHRVIDGAMAARYLQTMKQLIEQPAMLLV